ncbi:unnamed protein product, partial [Ectocarpus sp. 6 AP-2014]
EYVAWILIGNLRRHCCSNTNSSFADTVCPAKAIAKLEKSSRWRWAPIDGDGQCCEFIFPRNARKYRIVFGFAVPFASLLQPSTFHCMRTRTTNRERPKDAPVTILSANVLPISQ